MGPPHYCPVLRLVLDMRSDESSASIEGRKVDTTISVSNVYNIYDEMVRMMEALHSSERMSNTKHVWTQPWDFLKSVIVNYCFALGASGLAALVVSSSMDFDMVIRTLVEGYSHFLKLLLLFSVKRPKMCQNAKSALPRFLIRNKKQKKEVVMAFNPRT